VAEFLARRSEFAVAPARAALAGRRIDLPPGVPDDAFLRLRPDAHGTDAFFGALLERAT
jgi:16S rRNA C967 or C1407 C5-methylase (RsmB/RsmF family)